MREINFLLIMVIVTLTACSNSQKQQSLDEMLSQGIEKEKFTTAHSINELITSKITKPLGMQRTSLNLKEHDDNNFPDGYMNGKVTNRYKTRNYFLNGSVGIPLCEKNCR